MDLKKSSVKSVQATGMFNDLHKFEVEMEDGTTGMMYKKSDYPYIQVGDSVVYTLNAKGTIKIIPKDQENKANTGKSVIYKQNNAKKENLILIQCMYKCASEYHSHRSTSSKEDVSATAKEWYENAKSVVDEGAATIEKTAVKGEDDLPF